MSLCSHYGIYFWYQAVLIYSAIRASRYVFAQRNHFGLSTYLSQKVKFRLSESLKSNSEVAHCVLSCMFPVLRHQC